MSSVAERCRATPAVMKIPSCKYVTTCGFWLCLVQCLQWSLNLLRPPSTLKSKQSLKAICQPNKQKCPQDLLFCIIVTVCGPWQRSPGNPTSTWGIVWCKWKKGKPSRCCMFWSGGGGVFINCRSPGPWLGRFYSQTWLPLYDDNTEGKVHRNKNCAANRIRDQGKRGGDD